MPDNTEQLYSKLENLVKSRTQFYEGVASGYGLGKKITVRLTSDNNRQVQAESLNVLSPGEVNVFKDLDTGEYFCWTNSSSKLIHKTSNIQKYQKVEKTGEDYPVDFLVRGLYKRSENEDPIPFVNPSWGLRGLYSGSVDVKIRTDFKLKYGDAIVYARSDGGSSHFFEPVFSTSEEAYASAVDRGLLNNRAFSQNTANLYTGTDLTTPVLAGTIPSTIHEVRADRLYKIKFKVDRFSSFAGAHHNMTEWVNDGYSLSPTNLINWLGTSYVIRFHDAYYDTRAYVDVSDGSGSGRVPDNNNGAGRQEYDDVSYGDVYAVHNALLSLLNGMTLTMNYAGQSLTFPLSTTLEYVNTDASSIVYSFTMTATGQEILDNPSLIYSCSGGSSPSGALSGGGSGWEAVGLAIDFRLSLVSLQEYPLIYTFPKETVSFYAVPYKKTPVFLGEYNQDETFLVAITKHKNKSYIHFKVGKEINPNIGSFFRKYFQIRQVVIGKSGTIESDVIWKLPEKPLVPDELWRQAYLASYETYPPEEEDLCILYNRQSDYLNNFKGKWYSANIYGGILDEKGSYIDAWSTGILKRNASMEISDPKMKSGDGRCNYGQDKLLKKMRIKQIVLPSPTPLFDRVEVIQGSAIKI